MIDNQPIVVIGYDCISEFGEHDNHTDCQWIIENMSAGYPDETDYSGWYDYDAGLRWSDFVEGPIGD